MRSLVPLSSTEAISCGKRRALQFGHGLSQRVTERLRARHAQHALERIVPQRDVPVALHHGHALVERFDDLTVSMFVLDAARKRFDAVEDHIDRNRREWKEVPHVRRADLGDDGRHDGPGEVGRTGP